LLTFIDLAVWDSLYLKKEPNNIVMVTNDNRVALVSGAYGAIGFALAKKLVASGYEVIMAGRSERRLEEAVATLLVLYSKANVYYEVVDVSRKNSIKELAARWQGKLHLLINNAATAPREKSLTLDGLEIQFATNVLGYYWMMKYMSPFMKEVKDARIINVASYWAGNLDLEDLMFEERKYDNDTAYRQCKQANRMISSVFAQKLEKDNIKVNACHPGDVNSKLSNNLGYGGHESPEVGADTPFYLATSDEVKNISGRYFENKRLIYCPFSQDTEAIDKLYRFCSQI
jgi:NAD(P)-dependent dehydrogenase (short-subunit alcohol dehydrogenase family)